MKNEKNTITIVLSILVILFFPIALIAEEQMITYEMGEGNHTISFPMSQKEILEAKRIDKAREIINKKKRNIKETWFESYELPESGITINFPMSDVEARKAKSRYQALVKRNYKKSQLQREIEDKYEYFEFGEGGHTVKFLKTEP